MEVNERVEGDFASVDEENGGDEGEEGLRTSFEGMKGVRGGSRAGFSRGGEKV